MDAARSRANRVAVAMSGGVDSAVAAALLRDAGHDVIGMTARFWQRESQTPLRGCAVDAVDAARAAAEVLGIPHHVVDCHEEFERLVLRAAWEEYARGRTPNPCVLCNAALKFGLLFDHARRLGADHLATGHYAAAVRADDEGRWTLLRGRDEQKDQSYFLFALADHQLGATLFPLADLTKERVRELARQHGLPNAERPESQDACVEPGEDGFAEVLRRHFKAAARPGAIVDEAGNRLGEHAGIHRFTIGQRRGLGVALGQRAYVLRIDAERGDVVVGSDERALTASGLLASDMHWLVDLPRGAKRPAAVQVRYRHAPAPALVERTSSTEIRVEFDEPQRAVTPGQAAVLYDGRRVLGGGWIERALP